MTFISIADLFQIEVTQTAVSLLPADTGDKKEKTVIAALPSLLHFITTPSEKSAAQRDSFHFATQMIRIEKDREGGTRNNTIYHHNMGKLVSFQRCLQKV